MSSSIISDIRNALKKMKSDKDTDRVVNDLISNHLLHYTCQFFEKDQTAGMKPFASGVLAILGDSYYILTASHVTDYLHDDQQLYLRIQKGYVSVVGDLRDTDIEESGGIDLAYIRLDEKIVPDLLKAYQFLPLSKFRRHLKLLDAAQYCIIGFPVKNQKKVDGKLLTGASVYVVQPSHIKVYKHYGFNEESSIIMEFKGKGADLKTGELKKIKSDFYGLSGCGLWLIILEHDGKTYTSDFRLIGIMTEFRKDKFFCLIGNRIEIILHDLKENGLINYNEKKLTSF